MRYIYFQRRIPNLRSPRTFNDKVLFRLLYDRRLILQTISDRYAVREYLKEKIGAHILTKLYCVSDNPSSNPFETFPEQYVVRATHGSGWNYIVAKKKSGVVEEILELCNFWMTQNHYDYGGEWCYKCIQPKIIVEEFLTSDKQALPKDYKFFCFDGKVSVIQVVSAIQLSGSSFTRYQRGFYTPDWRELDIEYLSPKVDTPVPRPDNLESMIAISEKLGRELDFIRVDLYELNGRVYFGELTVYPNVGIGRFVPRSFDFELGRRWTIGKRSNLICFWIYLWDSADVGLASENCKYLSAWY